MLPKLTSISKLKEKFINERKDILASNVSALQKALYKKLFDKLIDALETEQGRIVNSKKNISSATVIDKIFKDFESDMSELMQKVTGDYTKLLGFNQQYFSTFNTALFNSVKQTVTDAMQARAGFNSKGFTKDGFIDSFIKDKTITRGAKQTILSAVLNGSKVSDLLKTLDVQINGVGKAPGALDNHFRTYIYDTYSEFDNSTGNQFAIQLGLNYAVYAGGIVDASRPFCVERNGKAFTREEIQKFGSPSDKWQEYSTGLEPNGGYTNYSKGEFAGKTLPKDGGYNPFAKPGGYRCGHTWNWCSFTIAKSIRPDIQKSTYDLKIAA